MVLIIYSMRILVRLVLNWKILEIISRFCATLSAIGCTSTEWRRPIECLKLQVIFRQRATYCRALLRKMTHKDKASYGSWPPCMGWLRLVCSLKLWVSFKEYRLFYRALLQTRPIILRSLLIVATP